jgi:hypothetical protein
VSDGIDKTALSYWFPKLVEAGIPVPKTKIIKMPEKAQKVIWEIFDGKMDETREDFAVFLRELATAAAEIGMPCFLRTDHTSAKHSPAHVTPAAIRGRIARLKSDFCDRLNDPSEEARCFEAVVGPFRRSPRRSNSVAIRGIADVAGARSKRQ